MAASALAVLVSFPLTTLTKRGDGRVAFQVRCQLSQLRLYMTARGKGVVTLCPLTLACALGQPVLKETHFRAHSFIHSFTAWLAVLPPWKQCQALGGDSGRGDWGSSPARAPSSRGCVCLRTHVPSCTKGPEGGGTRDAWRVLGTAGTAALRLSVSFLAGQWGQKNE